MKNQNRSWDGAYLETQGWLEWFDGEVPRCAAEFAQHFGLSKNEASSQLRRWLSRGWLVEEKAGSYSTARKPSFDEFVTPHPVDQSVEVFWVDYELLTFFSTPKTTAEYQTSVRKSLPTVLSAIRGHLGAGRLWQAGEVRGRIGPPAKLYCSDRTLARRAFWTWAVEEHEKREVREQPKPKMEMSSIEARLARLEELVGRLTGPLVLPSETSRAFDGTHANGGSFD